MLLFNPTRRPVPPEILPFNEGRKSRIIKEGKR